MDVRRLNDTLKILGAAVGALALFGPVFSKAHGTTGELVGDILQVLPGALGAFLAGFGTRGIGVEYKDVAEAQVKASMMPPSLPPAPPPVGK